MSSIPRTVGEKVAQDINSRYKDVVYSDEGIAGEYDSTGQELRTYGWSTNPLFAKIAGVCYWYHIDHLGTPQKIVTTSGAVVWEAVYNSISNCQVQVETISNSLRFPG